MSTKDTKPTITAKDLYAALRRRYGVDSRGGGIMVDEVSINGAFGASTRADALYMGFTSKTGRRLEGFEIKVTRGDWLAEIRNLDKGELWFTNCHRWWIVTLPDIVEPSELPDDWGLMVLERGALKVKVPAPTNDITPSWEVVRSVIARYDTLTPAPGTVKRLGDQLLEANARVRELEGSAGSNHADCRPPHEQRRHSERAKILDEIERAIGVRIVAADTTYWGSDGTATPEDFAIAVKGAAAVRQHAASRTAALERAGDYLRSTIRGLDDSIKTLEGLAKKEEK